MELPVTINSINQQFEIVLGDIKAEMVYRLREKSLYLMHTSVPAEMQGKGVGGALVEFALQYAKENQWEVVVYCPFVKSYLERKK